MSENKTRLEDTRLYKTAEQIFESIAFYHVKVKEDIVQKNGNTVQMSVPVGTVCIGKTKDGIYCRGISICSISDRFDRHEGRRLSLYRMLVAGLSGKRNGLIVLSFDRSVASEKSVERFFYHSLDVPCFPCKSDYDVELTDKESRILRASEVNA